MRNAPDIIAYQLEAQDDGSYMLGEETYHPTFARGEWHFGSEGAPHSATCSRCGGKVDPDYVNPQYRVKKRRRELTATYDGYLLGSSNLCRILKECGVESDDFIALPADPKYFWIRPRAILSYSARKRDRRCKQCGQFKDSVSPVPEFTKALAEPILSGVYRSSIEFGSVPLKASCTVVSVDIARALQSASLRGVELRPLHGAA